MGAKWFETSGLFNRTMMTSTHRENVIWKYNYSDCQFDKGTHNIINDWYIMMIKWRNYKKYRKNGKQFAIIGTWDFSLYWNLIYTNRNESEKYRMWIVITSFDCIASQTMDDDYKGLESFPNRFDLFASFRNVRENLQSTLFRLDDDDLNCISNSKLARTCHSVNGRHCNSF